MRAGLLAAALFVGCAHGALRVGPCAQPPLEHDGYALKACGFSVDGTHAWCGYQVVINGYRCHAFIETRDCRTWTLDEQHTGCEVVRTPLPPAVQVKT